VGGSILISPKSFDHKTGSLSYIVWRYLRDPIRLATVIGPQLVTDGHRNSKNAANTFSLMNVKFLSIEFECWYVTEDRDGKTIRLSSELSDSKSTTLTVRSVCTVSVRVLRGNTEVSFYTDNFETF